MAIATAFEAHFSLRRFLFGVGSLRDGAVNRCGAA